MPQDKTQIKGEVYTYDKDSDTLVVKDHAVGLQEANYRFLKGKDIDPASVKLTGTSRMPDPTPAVSDSTVDRSVYCFLFWAWRGVGMKVARICTHRRALVGPAVTVGGMCADRRRGERRGGVPAALCG